MQSSLASLRARAPILKATICLSVGIELLSGRLCRDSNLCTILTLASATPAAPAPSASALGSVPFRRSILGRKRLGGLFRYRLEGRAVDGSGLLRFHARLLSS